MNNSFISLLDMFCTRLLGNYVQLFPFFLFPSLFWVGWLCLLVIIIESFSVKFIMMFIIFCYNRLRQWGLSSIFPPLKIRIPEEHCLRFKLSHTILLVFFKIILLLMEFECWFQVLQRILMGTDVVKNVNKNNASHAVLFEALALVSLLLSSGFSIWNLLSKTFFDITWL